MTTPQHAERPSRFSGRTRLVTIVSIAVVGLAGATAVSANMGMFDTAPTGSAAAVAAPAAPAAQVVDVYLPSDTGVAATTSTTAAPVVAGSTAQEFTVDTAGIVAVASTPTGLRLDSVSPTPGWTWSLSQNSPTELTVTLTDGTRTLEFVATATPDGGIAASVSEPIVTPAPQAAPQAASTGGAQEHEGGGDDD